MANDLFGFDLGTGIGGGMDPRQNQLLKMALFSQMALSDTQGTSRMLATQARAPQLPESEAPAQQPQQQAQPQGFDLARTLGLVGQGLSAVQGPQQEPPRPPSPPPPVAPQRPDPGAIVNPELQSLILQQLLGQGTRNPQVPGAVSLGGLIRG